MCAEVNEIEQLKQELEGQKQLREDLSRQCLKREEIQKNKIEEIQQQNAKLRAHIKSLDSYVKRMSLVHSQVSAATQYPLSKSDIDEMLRLVMSI